MPTDEELQQQINEINERNRRVEADKAWETSWTRRVILLVLTYLVIVVFFLITKLPKPFVNSIVPAVAFVISTLTLSFFKTLWLKKRSNAPPPAGN